MWFIDKDNAYPTLEPQLVKANGLAKMNKILGCNYSNEDVYKRQALAGGYQSDEGADPYCRRWAMASRKPMLSTLCLLSLIHI